MSALPDSVGPGREALDSAEITSYDEEATRALALERCNRMFSELKPLERIEWAIENLPSNHVMTSSFGAQAAVSLHLITRVKPDIPVILIDTGYLFPETYRFIDELTERLKLNLHVYRAALSPGEATRVLAAKAERGALDPDAVVAVAGAADQQPPQIRRPAGLTDREVEVLGLLARGWATKQIAARLGISVKTADRHIQNIYGTIGVSSRAAATLYAVENGLVV